MTGNATLNNTGQFSFHFPAAPAIGETVTIACVASDVVVLTPTSVSFTAADVNATVLPSMAITVKPYYVNDLSPSGSRPYTIACTVASATVSPTTPMYGNARVHGVTGTIYNSVYPTWQDAYVFTHNGTWESAVVSDGNRSVRFLLAKDPTVFWVVGVW